MRKSQLFKKIIAIISLLVVVLFSVCACGDIPIEDNAKSGNHDGMVKIYQVALSVASPNENHVHYVRYPFYYSVFAADNDYIDIETSQDDKWIPQEDFDFFIDFINKYIDDDTRPTDSIMTYNFKLSYYDEGGNSVISMVYGYDSFPDELSEVIDRLNKLCGENIMEHPNEMIEDVPSFIYQETGVSEADYPREDIEKMLEEEGFMALDEMFSDSVGFEKMMSGYYGAIAEKNIEEYKTREIREATHISNAEYVEFVNKYLEKLGEDWSLTEELSQDKETMITRGKYAVNGHMYIAKAEIVEKWKKEGDLKYNDGDGCITYSMVVGGEGQSLICDFIYNEDASCVLINYKDSGIGFDERVKDFYYLRSKE